MDVCTECGFEAASYTGLLAHQRGKHAADAVKVEAPAAVAVAEPSGPRSVRGRRRAARDMQALSALEQIRGRPAEVQGPFAYYIRPEGATIRDALIGYPNGAKLTREEDPRGRHSENAEYYQARQGRKGFEYVGPTLTPQGVRRLVEVLETNKEDEILDLEDQIEACESDIKNSDRPEWRDNQRKRKAKLARRLEQVRTPLNAEALIKELNDIAEAQRLARLDPAILAALQALRGEIRSEMLDMVEHFRSTVSTPGEGDMMSVGSASIE